MADMLKKVQRGQPLVIPASTFNAFVDAAQDFQRRKLSQQSTGQSTSRDADMVLIKNASGADRARFEILGTNAPVFTPTDNLDEFRNRVALSGVVPTAANHWGKFVVLAEPIRNGARRMSPPSGSFVVSLGIHQEQLNTEQSWLAAAGDEKFDIVIFVQLHLNVRELYKVSNIVDGRPPNGLDLPTKGCVNDVSSYATLRSLVRSLPLSSASATQHICS